MEDRHEKYAGLIVVQDVLDVVQQEHAVVLQLLEKMDTIIRREELIQLLLVLRAALEDHFCLEGSRLYPLLKSDHYVAKNKDMIATIDLLKNANLSDSHLLIMIDHCLTKSNEDFLIYLHNIFLLLRIRISYENLVFNSLKTLYRQER
ncbi:MAG: hypothetical protein HQM06_08020 [Magnetococcales bacterium]|nr:hypothetical protein [Magnetococcales bacterium]